MMPIRIQRKRTKGWKMPENTVYVGRPTKWGNPFKLRGDMIYGNAGHRRKILSPWIYIEPSDNDWFDWRNMEWIDIVLKLYENWLRGCDQNNLIPPPTAKEIKSELRGKNLACFCKDGEKCHADFLLKIANQ